MDTQDVRNRVRSFIISNFYVSKPETLGDSTSLLDTGIIDSTGVLELVAYLESEFAVTVGDAEMLPSNFDAIDRITAYLQRKTGG